MSGDDFLSRWSRRKLGARQEEARAPDAPPADPPAEEQELTPEEIAALPKVEDLTPETDITVFFRKGVPEFLRNAALRRMWSLDPAIRDFEGPARDYAWDWNVPGGVPGNGPMLPTDDVESMVRQVFGESRDASTEAEPEHRPGDQSSQADGADAAAGEVGEPVAGSAAAQREPDGQPASAEPNALPPPDSIASAHEQHSVAPRDHAGQQPSAAPPARRHGRARPV